MTSSHVPSGGGPLEQSQSSGSLFCEIAIARLNSQMAQVDALDNKASTMLGIGSLVLPVTAAIAVDGAAVNSGCVIGSFLVAAIFFAGLFVFFFQSFGVRDWDLPPKPQQWKEVSEMATDSQLRHWLGDACTTSFVENARMTDKKARHVQNALFCLGAELAFTLAGVIFLLV